MLSSDLVDRVIPIACPLVARASGFVQHKAAN
jgi:hypothetical protein